MSVQVAPGSPDVAADGPQNQEPQSGLDRPNGKLFPTRRHSHGFLGETEGGLRFGPLE